MDQLVSMSALVAAAVCFIAVVLWSPLTLVIVIAISWVLVKAEAHR